MRVLALLVVAALAALLALWLWRRPREVWATRWDEPEDGVQAADPYLRSLWEERHLQAMCSRAYTDAGHGS